MIGMCLLQKCTIDITKSAAACSYLFLHAHQLGQVKTVLLRSPSLSRHFLIFFPVYFIPLTPAIWTGNMQHIPHISFYTGFDGFSDLFIGNNSLFFGIIDLASWCHAPFCKTHPFQFITD